MHGIEGNAAIPDVFKYTGLKSLAIQYFYWISKAFVKLSVF